MPSSVSNVVGNTTVGANYLKAKPSTRFSTRDLAFLVIDMDNSSYFNNYANADSNFSKVVRAVQTQAEIYAVGTPDSGVVTIVVAIDTTNDGDYLGGNPDNENNMAHSIGNVLSDAGINADSVQFKRLLGGGFTSQDMSGYGAGGETYVP